MQIPRFFIDPGAIDMESRVVAITDQKLIGQILKVLRMRPGEKMDLLDGRGHIYHCTLEQGSNHGRCQASIDSSEPAQGEPSVLLTVALPPLKSGRFEWAIEKLTELGVNKIVPLETERGVVKPSGEKGDGGNKISRWHAIAREAAEQCERGLIPDVVSPISLKDLLRKSSASNCKIFVCAERSGKPDLAALLAGGSIEIGTASLVVLIGPEGGFTKAELDAAEEAGAQFVTLGKRILRSETAAVCSASLLVSHLDK